LAFIKKGEIVVFNSGWKDFNETPKLTKKGFEEKLVGPRMKDDTKPKCIMKNVQMICKILTNWEINHLASCYSN